MHFRQSRTSRPTFVSPLVIAGASALAMAGPVLAAVPYQATPVVTLPVVLTDGTTAALPTNYTSLSLASTSAAAMPNGSYTSLITAVLSGTTVTGGYSESTAYAYDPTNGLRAVGEYFPTSTGAHANTSIRGVNAAFGQVLGASPINSNLATSISGDFGNDLWVSTGIGSTTSIGLTGPNFSYTKTMAANGTTYLNSVTATYRSSSGQAINALGQVIGSTSRYAGDGSASPATSLGSAAFIYNPGAGSTEIGLVGTNYSYNAATTIGGPILGSSSSNSTAGLNSTGVVIGSATPYYDTSTTGTGTTTPTSLGQDAWVYRSGTTTAVGLYQNGADPVGLSGFGANGIHYYGKPTGTLATGATQGYGPVGSSASLSSTRYTTLYGLNTAGQTIGTSQMYNSAGSYAGGQDAFRYTPTGIGTGTYQQLGFYTDTPLSATPAAGDKSYINSLGTRSTSVAYINTSGQVAGTSTLYVAYQNGASVSTTSGSSAFLSSTAGTPTRIGLYGQTADPLATSSVVSHVSSQGAASSSISNLTDGGLVAGYSTRYATGTTTNLGQDAWVYDPTTLTNYLLDPTDAAKALYTSSQVTYLSEDGYAVGRYLASTTTSSSGGYNKSFIWSVAGGFEDLNANTTGLTAAQYANLVQAFYTGGLGNTVYSTASTTASSTVNGIFTLAVPEPASLSVLAVGAASLLARRRIANRPTIA